MRVLLAALEERELPGQLQEPPQLIIAVSHPQRLRFQQADLLRRQGPEGEQQTDQQGLPVQHGLHQRRRQRHLQKLLLKLHL